MKFLRWLGTAIVTRSFHILEKLVAFLGVAGLIYGLAAHEVGLPLPDEHKYWSVITIFLLLAAYEQVTRSMRATESLAKRFESSLPKRYSLKSSINDLVSSIENAKNGAATTVAIDHFGLDLAKAWGHVEDLLEDAEALTRVHYRLLFMSEKKDDFSLTDVKEWCQFAHQATLRIRHFCERTKASPPVGKKIHLEVRQYVGDPTIHGWRVKQPVDVCYLSSCRWNKKNRYDWGGDNYVRVAGNSLDPVLRDWLEVFESHFEHFWNAEETRVLVNEKLGVASGN